MTLNEVLERNGIMKAHIAERIGMDAGTFKNKLRDNHSAKFTSIEMVKILEVLDEISKDLRTFITSV